MKWVSTLGRQRCKCHARSPEAHGKAAIDTTSGHAVDSFFLTDSQADPWAEQCLVNFIDILINHDTVKFPVPSRAHANAVDDDLLPLSVAEGRRIELLSPKSG